MKSHIYTLFSTRSFQVSHKASIWILKPREKLITFGFFLLLSLSSAIYIYIYIYTIMTNVQAHMNGTHLDGNYNDQTPQICVKKGISYVSSHGVFHGDSPLNFVLPITMLQIFLSLMASRIIYFLLRPLRTPRLVCNLLVYTYVSSPISSVFSFVESNTYCDHLETYLAWLFIIMIFVCCDINIKHNCIRFTRFIFLRAMRCIYVWYTKLIYTKFLKK